MLKIPLSKKTLIPLGMINGITFGITACAIGTLNTFFDCYWRNAQLACFDFKALNLKTSDRVLSLSVIFCIAATLASLIVNRYAARYTKSIFWFWQAIGIVTLLVFELCSPIYVSYYALKYPSTVFTFLERVTNVLAGDLWMLLILLPIISIFNLLFALTLKRFSKTPLL